MARRALRRRHRQDGAGSPGRLQAPGGRGQGDDRLHAPDDVPGRGARRRNLAGWLSASALPRSSVSSRFCSSRGAKALTSALTPTVVEPSGHPALYLDLAEVKGGPRAGGLRRVHLFEDRARVAHLLLRLEVPDEDGRSLCFVDKQLESG